LFLEFVRFVKELNPEIIVLENVTGILAKKNINTLKSIKCIDL
jgi:DNA (cytosine-5)-methyltransferase 1